MEYPWVDNIVIAAPADATPVEDTAPADTTLVEDTPPDEETGTNEPVSIEDQPDPELANDLTGEDQVSEQPVIETDTGIQTQIDDLKKQIEELNKDKNLQLKVDLLEKRLNNISVQDQTDLIGTIFQSASSEIKYIKRAIRRIKQSSLSGEQQQLISNELEQTPELSCQEIAAKLAQKLNASEQDIIDFIRNTDYRFRHRHRRDASVINWDEIS